MQIPKSKLQTVRGKVIGVGKANVFRTPGRFDSIIPALSFVVIEKNENDGYISSCIQLQIDGYGKTIESALRDMAENIAYYLGANFTDEANKEICWTNLFDLFEINESNSILWDKYHAF